MKASLFLHSALSALRRTASAVSGLFGASALLLCAALAAHPAYPAHAGGPLCLSGSATILLPQPEGGQTDMIYKPLRDVWQRHTGAALAFSHKPGRGGSYAVTGAMDAGGDGCTLAAVQMPSLFLLAADADGMFAPDDVAPVSVFASAPLALWVAEDGPLQTMDALVTFMRTAMEQGGEAAVIAGAGSYTDQHLAFLRFERAAGVKGRYMAALGSAEAARAVREGNAAACFAYALPNPGMSGTKALAVAAASRSAALPEAPTLRELGIDMESLTYFGLALPVSVSEDKRAGYTAALAGLAEDAALAKALAASGAKPEAVPPLKLAATLAAWADQALAAIDAYNLFPRNRRR